MKLSYTVSGNVQGANCFRKIVWQFLKMLNIDLIISFPGIHPKEMKICIYLNLHMNLHSSRVAKQWIQPRSPSNNGGIGKILSTNAIDYYWTTKKQAVLLPATVWMQLENIILSGKGQWLKSTYCMIPFIMKCQE